MDEGLVKKSLKLGAPITCATCRFYYEGNGFCNQTACGGPGSGKDFPFYDGPIPREKLVERCLVCGSGKIEYRILLPGDQTDFSLCKKHRKVFDYVTGEDGIQRLVKVIALP